MNFEKQITNYMQAGYPLLWVRSAEEFRTVRTLQKIAKSNRLDTWNWTVTQGWENGENALPDLTDPMQALNAIRDGQIPEKSVLTFVNFHHFLDLPEMIQSVKDLGELCKATERYLIFVSPSVDLPLELQKDITLIDFSLPTQKELATILDYVLDSVENITVKNGVKKRAVEAAMGMTAFEAENAFALSLVEAKKISPEVIQREKIQTIKKSGLLEYYEPNETLADVGGLDLLKGFLGQRKKTFDEIEKARAFGLEPPKGIIVTGVPGTGKSLTAKATSALWGLPLLRWDVGRSFSRYVGESEQKFSQVFELAQALSPIILWVDEIEKAFAGVGSSGELDGGVTAKTFGQFLTFIEENTEPIFIFATSNNIQVLPGELIRRFDAVFSVDLPTAAERREIFMIHLRKRNREPGKFKIDEFVKQTDGYSGAEIEKSIVAGLHEAFDEGKELTGGHILSGIKETPPLAKVMPEKVLAIREWIKMNGAKPATSAKKKDVVKVKPRVIKVDNTLAEA